MKTLTVVVKKMLLATPGIEDQNACQQLRVIKVEMNYLTVGLALDAKSLFNGTLLALLLHRQHYRN